MSPFAQIGNERHALGQTVAPQIFDTRELTGLLPIRAVSRPVYLVKPPVNSYPPVKVNMQSIPLRLLDCDSFALANMYMLFRDTVRGKGKLPHLIIRPTSLKE